MYVFLRDRFFEEQEVHFPLNDLGLIRNYSIFDFFRTLDGIPLFAEDYLDRFFHSAENMFLPVKYNREELKAIIEEFITLNKLETSGIRVLLTGGATMDGYSIMDPLLLITAQSIAMPSQEQFEKGLSLVSWEYQREMPAIKTTDYKTGIWLHKKMVHRYAADDVIYHMGGSVTELPRCNIFAVTQDNRIITPAHHILKGITRKKILELASSSNETSEEEISIGTLMDASEVFITATSKRILPVTRIDGRVIGNGSPGIVTRQLLSRFLDMESAYIKDRALVRPA